MTEHDVQNLILDYLNRQPDFFAWRNNSSGIYDSNKKVYRKKVGFDINGVSDVLSIFKPHGLLVAIEVKKPGSTPSSVSKEQNAFIKKINGMGGTACWTDSLEDVILLVEELRRKYGLVRNSGISTTGVSTLENLER